MQDIHEEEDLGVVYDGRLIKRLLGYARPHALALAMCVLMVFGLAALKLSQPYWISLAIDRVMTPGATADAAAREALAAQLLPLALAFFASALGASVLEYGQGLLLRITGQSIIARIRQEVFDHLNKLGLAYFDANPVGRLVTRVTNDVEALNEMYTSVLVNLFKDVAFITGAMALMLQRDVKLALVCFAVVPLIGFTAISFQRLSRGAWRAVRIKLARLNSTLSETFSGMRVIHLFAREAKQSAEFAAINQAHYEASMHQLRIYAVFRPLLELLSTFALVGIVWFGGAAALAGAVSFGTLYAFTAYSRQLFDPLNELAEKYNVLQSALASAERIFQLLNTVPTVSDRPGAEAPQVLAASATREQEKRPQSPPPSVIETAPRGEVVPAPGQDGPGSGEEDLTPVVIRTAETAEGENGEEPGGAGHQRGATSPFAIEFRDVWFAYRGEEWVLQGVSFQVPAGTTAAFVGHTGAGKSTLMALVARFYDVQRGAVLVDGRDVRDWPQAALRRRVGTVMQDVFLFAGDVAGNIGLGDATITRERIEEAARVVGADAFIRRLPQGYDEPVRERGATLSSGQRQLISFARAIAYDPAVLVLDEATAQIDSETEAALQEAMRTLARGRTTLVVAHRLSTIQDAERIFVMHKGTVREQGRHAELVALGGLYHRLWQLQFEAAREGDAPS